ncbi:MAG: tetratricopeptide repeat protein [Methylococcales bacterium]
MEVYNSEEEQLDAMKKWWTENGRSIIAGIVVGLIAIFGWKIWTNHSLTKAQEASHLFQQLLVANKDKQTDSIITIAGELQEKYPSTIYGAYANLFKAKALVISKDLDGAKVALNTAIGTSTDLNIKHIARIRLGRIMLASGEIEQSLQLLETVDIPTTGKFSGLYQELKGDLYMKLTREDDARSAYQQALMSGGGNPAVLQVKLDQVTVPLPELTNTK